MDELNVVDVLVQRDRMLSVLIWTVMWGDWDGGNADMGPDTVTGTADMEDCYGDCYYNYFTIAIRHLQPEYPVGLPRNFDGITSQFRMNFLKQEQPYEPDSQPCQIVSRNLL